MSAESRLVGVTPPEEIPAACMTKKDFARYVGRSEATVGRLIRKGIIVALHDGRSVTIPVDAAMKQYLEYLEEQEEKRSSRPEKPVAEAPTDSPYRTRFSDIAFATDDFIVDAMKPPKAPEQSPETPE
jgi:hypothetical protein